MSNNGEDAEAEDKAQGKSFSGVRRMVEDITVTPFFGKHSSHMPATIKLHAEIVEEGKWVILRTEIPGYTEELVDVSASENTINITIHSEEAGENKSNEATHEGAILLHSSYVTPVPVNPEKLKVSRKGEMLEVKVSKK